MAATYKKPLPKDLYDMDFCVPASGFSECNNKKIIKFNVFFFIKNIYIYIYIYIYVNLWIFYVIDYLFLLVECLFLFLMVYCAYNIKLNNLHIKIILKGFYGFNFRY